jgi:hypothetical protein
MDFTEVDDPDQAARSGVKARFRPANPTSCSGRPKSPATGNRRR